MTELWVTPVPQDLTAAVWRLGETPRDIQDVRLRKRLVIWLAAVRVLVDPEPERLNGRHSEPPAPRMSS
jgi:hypothetical protein